MLAGNPFEFAISMREVELWNANKAFRNGLLTFSVDGFCFPSKQLVSVTLVCAAPELSDKLAHIPTDEALLCAPKAQAFEALYSRVYDQQDYRYELSPQELSDRDCLVFAVRDAAQVRILAAELAYDKERGAHDCRNAKIQQAYISCEELEELALALKQAQEQWKREDEVLRLKKLRESAQLPQLATAGSVGYDLCADLQQPLTLQPGQTQTVPTGLAAQLPQGCAGFIFARSGLGVRHGIVPANCVGVIDNDYRGELLIGLYNHSSQPFTIQPGDRIAQLVLMPVHTPPIQLCEQLDESERGAGGFGSTGLGSER